VLFAKLLDAVGLDSRYGAYVDHLPAITLATVNLMSWMGLHRVGAARSSATSRCTR
jgi:hypothetical protein